MDAAGDDLAIFETPVLDPLQISGESAQVKQRCRTAKTGSMFRKRLQPLPAQARHKDGLNAVAALPVPGSAP
jgi:hypothetical protein